MGQGSRCQIFALMLRVSIAMLFAIAIVAMEV